MGNEIIPSKFGMKDKVGYMFGDLANGLTFIFASSFLMIFYTDVLKIDGSVVGLLFLLVRFIDAISDVTMGNIVDKVRISKHDKFKPWILWISGPVAIMSFLMYQSFMASAPMTIKIIYMYITYILWSAVCYTGINIPYGSMASVITSDVRERTSLSTFRNIGSVTSNLVVGVITPLFIYTKNSSGGQVVRGGSIFTIVAAIFSIIAFICYMLCYRLTTERIKTTGATVRKSFRKSFVSVIENRALVGIILASLFLLVAQLTFTVMNNYLFPGFYNSSKAISIFNLVCPLIILFIVSPCITWITNRFGKKEVSIVASLLAAIPYLILFVMHTHSLVTFLVLSTISYIGFGSFSAIIWGMIVDVIDDQELKVGEREDGVIYAIYSFSRKCGQAIAGGITGFALSMIHYSPHLQVQSQETLNKLYDVSTLVPAIAYILVLLSLLFIYPISKNRALESSRKLAELRKQKI